MNAQTSHQWIGLRHNDFCAVCFVGVAEFNDLGIWCAHEQVGGDCVDCGVMWPCPTEIRRQEAAS